MQKTVCRICLRSDFQRIDDIDMKLFDFYDELCDFDVLFNDYLKFCTICEHLLRKFYNFRLRCQRAHKILKTHKKKGIENLQNLLPPPCIGFSSQSDNQNIINLPPRDEDQPENNELQNEELIDFVIKTEDIDDPIAVTKDIKLYLEHDVVKQEDVSKSDDFAMTCTQTDSTNTKQIDLINNDEIVLRSDEIILKNDEIIIENNELLTNDEMILLSDEIILKNDEIIIENNELLTNDEMILLSDEIILKNDEVMIENDEIVITKAEEIISDPFDADNFDSDDEEITKLIEKNVPKKALKPKKIIQPKNELKRKLDDQTEIDDVFSVGDLKHTDTTKQKETIVQKQLAKLKEKVINILERGTLDLGDHVKMTKDTFLDMLDKCDKTIIPRTLRSMVRNDSRGLQKIKKFLLFLWKHFDPKYETVFRIEYLTTHEQKLAEFKARSKSEEYLNAEFKCGICYKTFETLGLLEYHSKMMHDESRGHACEICSMRFGSRANLSSHGRQNHFTVYRCKECPLTLYCFAAMRNHYDGHKGKTYTCDVCQKQSHSFTGYKTHRQRHGSYDCPHCKKRFLSTQGLDNHVKTKHSGIVAKMSCDECGADYISRKLLIRHIQKHHSTTVTHITSFKCKQKGCLAQFPSAAARRRHETDSGHAALSADRKPAYWTCAVCGERVANTKNSSLFSHHKEAHPGVPYVRQNCTLCEQCGKAVNQSIFGDHMNKHTGVKPYDCGECGERFHMAWERHSHRMRHFPKNYECEFCGKKFRTWGNLFCHRRTHIGDRCFKCKICSKGFLHPGSLKEHIRGVHHHIRRAKATRNTDASDSKTTRNTDASDFKTIINTEATNFKTTRKTRASSNSKTTRKIKATFKSDSDSD